MANNPRCIGRVKHVRGATLTVALDPALVGVTPLWEGRLHPVGQVGSFVLMPQGPTSLIATVTLVSIAELTGRLEPSSAVQVGDRWLQVQLLGEIDSVGRFHRGVSAYPGLDDPVHFTVAADLRAIFPGPGRKQVRIGCLAGAPDVPLTLNAPRLVTRHSAIVGSTGSGKTSAVASLIQNFVSAGFGAANIVVIDPHGEYADAFQGTASIRSVLGAQESLLRVPYWALPSSDLLGALCGNTSKTAENRFNELVVDARRDFAAKADWMDVPPEKVTTDSPIPFDINQIWFQMDSENRATYTEQGGGGTEVIEEAGSAEELKPTRFGTHGLGNAAPFKGPTHGLYSLAPDRMRTILADPLLRFLVDLRGDPKAETDPLVGVIQEWLGSDKSVSVLDFSGVPNEVTDLAVGVVLQLLFELAVRSDVIGIGRARPVLIVLEEAHRYMSEERSTLTARRSANQIAREGRKYGIGLLLVTQRPSELPDTALSQVGTLVSLRLTNGTDQATVRSALPDSVTGLVDSLPALRTGEAVVTGEAVSIPSRVLFDLPNPQPRASDPGLDSWCSEPTINEIAEAVRLWRGDRKVAEDD